MSGADLAAAAEALVGTRFRLNGRDPATGLDCIGLLHAALVRCNRPAHLPTGYTLRLRDPDRWIPDPGACGFTPAQLPFMAGDAVLLQVGPAQLHLAIHAGRDGWVHAHAGLRRVIHQPDLPPGQLVQHWRLAPQT